MSKGQRSRVENEVKIGHFWLIKKLWSGTPFGVRSFNFGFVILKCRYKKNAGNTILSFLAIFGENEQK